MQKLDDLSHKFLKTILAVSKYGCPIPALYIDTNMLLMKNRILLQKLLFVFHLSNLPLKSLGRECYEEQHKNGYPGIITQCKPILDEWGLHDLRSYTKTQYKRIISNKIKIQNRNDLIQWISEKKYKKVNIETCAEQKFEIQDYLKNMNLSSAQLMFKVRYFLTPTVRGNFKSDKKFRDEMWRCPDCAGLDDKSSHHTPQLGLAGGTAPATGGSPTLDNFDSQTHLIVDCVANQDLREGRDMFKPQDLIDFFRDLIARRKERYEC